MHAYRRSYTVVAVDSGEECATPANKRAEARPHVPSRGDDGDAIDDGGLWMLSDTRFHPPRQSGGHHCLCAPRGVVS
jgi:hypothetical protein